MARHRKLTQKFAGFPMFKLGTNTFTYPFTHSFTKNFVGLEAALDVDAKDYIDAVVATGVTVTLPQRLAISNFIKAEKAASRWTSIRRLFFPIWGSAAANAIDMKIRSTGTYVGGVTHAAGYVQGNGSTGYFNFGTPLTSIGLTASNGMLFALCNLADTNTDPRSLLAVTNSTGFEGIDSSSGSSIRMYYGNGTSGQGQLAATLSPRSAHTGVFTASYDGTTRNFRRRNSTGTTSLGSTAGIAYSITNNQNMYAMALNSVGSAVRNHNGRFGSYGAGLSMSNSDADAFSANLKTLWETSTGLLLP